MAVRFTGPATYYRATTGLPAGTTWSYTAWVYLSVDRNEYSEMISFGSGDCSLSTDASGTTTGLFDSASNAGAPVGSYALSVGIWYQVAACVAGANVDVYCAAEGGPLVKTSATNYSPPSPSPSALAIGGYNDSAGLPGYDLNGRITNFKLWSAKLTQAEVEAELPTYTVVRTPGLIRAHQLKTPSTADDSGNGNTLTATGSLTTEAGPTTLDPAGPPLWTLLLSQPYTARRRAANF
jgi:hypothetical protein